MKKYIVILLILLFTGVSNQLCAQVKGKESPDYNKDTIFVFESPRPLLNKDLTQSETKQAWGLDLLLSDNGFGFGIFYQKMFDDDWFGFSSLYMSGARNTDELQLYDYVENKYYIKDKLNRIYMLPLTIGIQRYFFRDLLHDNIKPYLNLGLGETLIISAPSDPYDNNIFPSLGKALYFGRFAGFFGGGVNVGSGSSLLSVNMRYYYIPFGGKGLESVKGSPINDFGGIFLSLSLGTKF